MKIINIFLLSFLLGGCYSAQHHFDKYIEKGGKITPEIVRDTVPLVIKGVDGKDSLIYVPVEVKVDCPDTPETNSQTRQRERTERLKEKNEYNLEIKKLKYTIDSLKVQNKHAEKEQKLDNNLEKILSKERERIKQLETKLSKTEARNKGKWWFWMLLGAFLMLIVVIFIVFLYKKLNIKSLIGL